jgi:preprotein translocase subunit SecY
MKTQIIIIIIIIIITIIIIIIIIYDSEAQRGLWPHRPRGFLITHND